MKLKSKYIHQQQVQKLQYVIQQDHKSFSFKKDGPSNTLRSGDYKKQSLQLDLSSFNEILDFNKEEGWIVVEPRITFVSLCRLTLEVGYIPLVVPEFTTITVGGAIMGAALESSSHRYGQVNDTCIEYELVLGNGEQTTASAQKNSDLFYALAGSYGTLGILTSVKLKIREAKKWVHLIYHHFADIKEAIEMLSSPHKADFIEGIVYSRSQIVVIKGYETDRCKERVYRQHRPWSPWYVQHILQTPNKEESMLLNEYLFRFDRGGFWIGQHILSLATMARLLLSLGIPTIKPRKGFPNFLFRLLFGWSFSSEKLYHIWHKVPTAIKEQLFFIHDFYSPSFKATELLDKFINETGIFPIWLCPIKGTSTPQFLSPHFGNADLINIGLYGMPSCSCSVPALSADIEKEILSYGGRKMLYSFTYYDPATFSHLYSDPLYTQIRKKYFAEKAFPTLYQKVAEHTLS